MDSRFSEEGEPTTEARVRGEFSAEEDDCGGAGSGLLVPNDTRRFLISPGDMPADEAGVGDK